MPRHNRWFALALVLLLPCAAAAEVKIAPSCRIKNRPPGRCGWCALETLARHHRIKCLYDVTEDNATRCDPEDLESALDKAGVRYRIQYPGSRDTAILRYAIRKNLGAVVGFRELYPGAGGHIVTLIEFSDDAVKVIDSNDQDGRIRTMDPERFLYWWDGFALVLEAERRAEVSDTATSSPRQVP
jgi:ABC-type bacteriocin/lantibiotic exporter with double-glycine peptidase domain